MLDLQGHRLGRRHVLLARRTGERERTTRRALERLYQGGTLFTPDGTQQGRALLAALRHLQRARARLEELGGDGPVPAPRLPARVDALCREVEHLLERADALAGLEAPASVTPLRS